VINWCQLDRIAVYQYATSDKDNDFFVGVQIKEYEWLGIIILKWY